MSDKPSDIREVLEGLENYITWVEDYPGELVHVDNESTEAKIHLSTVREWVEGARAAVDDHKRLADWILANCPEEIGEGDPVHGESAAEIAIRIIQERNRLTAALEEVREELKITEKQHRDCYRQLNHERVENYKLSQKLKTPLRKDEDTALSGKGEGEEEDGPNVPWEDVKRRLGLDSQPPPDPPPDPVCTHCGDTRRVPTECGNVICPMCRPAPDPPRETCGGSGAGCSPLPEGKTCGDCVHFEPTCKWLLNWSPRFKACDWAPSRYCPKGCKPEPVDFETCPHCGKQTALSRECVFDLAEGDSESPPAESVCTECGKAFTIERLKCE